MFLFVWGCAPREGGAPVSEQVTIGDLAPQRDGRSSPSLNATNLDVLVFQVPSERIRDLRGLWDILRTDAFLYGHHQAFRSNAFRVARGTVQQWDWILGSLSEAGARPGGTVSVWLTADEENDMTVAVLGEPQKVAFLDNEGRPQELALGPGRLVLRFWTEPMTSSVPSRRLVAYPVFTRGSRRREGRWAALAKDQEVAFSGAAFSTPLQEGDVLVLGPEEYCGDSSTLGGMFFSDPKGQMTVEPGSPTPVQVKGAVRIYAMMCTRLPEEAQ